MTSQGDEMKKALEILNQQLRDETLWLDSHEEAIKELEEAMKPKTCEGCKNDGQQGKFSPCEYCSRRCIDRYESKDTQC